MPEQDDTDAGIEVRVAVADWRAYVGHRCEEAGVPYTFQIDLEHGATAVINPRNPPDETAITDRIAELTRTTRPGDHDRR